MSTPRKDSSSAKRDSELLQIFIDHISSVQPISIPLGTLCGGITHYLSTLEQPDLGKFATAIASSEKLWSDFSLAKQVQHAVRMSVSVKVTAVESSLGQAYFAKSRSDRAMRRWLGALLDTIGHNTVWLGKEHFVSGLLIGLGDTRDVEWGQEGMRLEEEVVLILAGREADIASVPWASDVIPHIEGRRLRVLDLQVLLPALRSQLQASLDHKSEPGIVASIAKAISHLFKTLNSGNSGDRAFAWKSMCDFCLESRLPTNFTIDQDWEAQKLALFAFLLPATAILEIQLHSQPPPLPSTSDALDPSAHMAIGMLHTLYTYSDVIDTSGGGFEDYQRVLLGCLDVSAARGGVEGTTRLFKALAAVTETSDAKDSFVLVLGEELVNSLEGALVRDILLVKAEKHLSDPSHRPSFEAAHAFLLALIEASTKRPDVSVYPFMNELLPFYARLLLQQADTGDVSANQLRSAFASVCKCTSLQDRSALAVYLDLLGGHSNISNVSLARTVRLLRIDIASLIPHHDLKRYLDDLAVRILETAMESNERLEISAAAFKMVVQGLPDESRRTGMEWWMKWRDRFEGIEEERHRETIRARL